MNGDALQTARHQRNKERKKGKERKGDKKRESKKKSCQQFGVIHLFLSGLIQVRSRESEVDLCMLQVLALN